ncbi:hypothetical protein PTTG_26858, partial [Puccinia triticina 1-1 BBBD Race 1]|uniref:Uncharacterized protein n=2 Tax=Puccinia triticina TaxID=208348 RepID=A0A0C4FDC4_PUCT1
VGLKGKAKSAFILSAVSHPRSLHHHEAKEHPIQDWIDLVTKHYPELFVLSKQYLEVSLFIQVDTLLSPLADLHPAKALFLRVAKGFIDPGPAGKNRISHVFSVAMMVAAAKTPLECLPETLLS